MKVFLREMQLVFRNKVQISKLEINNFRAQTQWNDSLNMFPWEQYEFFELF